MSTLRIGSLCSGYEGLSLAVMDVLGAELAWVAENDPAAAAVLAYRFPGVPNLGDITQVRWSEVGTVDIVTAGFPCQDLSVAGQRQGIRKGNRSGLWYTIADALGVLRPRIVVLENVAALVAKRPGFDVVLADLAALGFDAEWCCLRASDVGAPHQRDRVFVIACPAADALRKGGRENSRGASRDEDPHAWRTAEHDHVSVGAGAERAAAATAEDANGSAWRERRVTAPGQAESRGTRADARRPGGAPAGIGPGANGGGRRR